MARLVKKKAAVALLPLGISRIDRAVKGLKAGQRLIFQAPPGVGRSAFAMTLLGRLGIESGVPTAFFSIELTKQQVLVRLASAHARIDLMQFYLGKGSETAQEKFTQTLSEIARAPLEIFAAPRIDLVELEKEMTRMKEQKGIRLFIVDHLRLVQPEAVAGIAAKKGNRLKRVLDGFEKISKKLKVPLLLLDHLSMEPEKGRLDKENAKLIRQNADVLLRLESHEVFEEQKGKMKPDHSARIEILKNANGKTGGVNLTFLPKYSRFEAD